MTADNATATAASMYAIRAVDRVCSILDALANATGGVALPEVAKAADLPKSSAFRYLSALEARHYVERDPNGMSYRLGVAFRPQHPGGNERLTELARPLLEKLRDQLQETVNLGILDGAQVVHAAVSESPHMMRLAARVGERGYVHCTALGKAICAALPDERVRAILEVSGMPAFTSATLIDPDSFLAELERTRAQGFGIDEAENQAAGRCVAVAIENIPFLAGVSVSAPAGRLPIEKVPDVVRQLKAVALKLSRQMHV
jgi:IclR family acetate operon transcriptional repressor